MLLKNQDKIMDTIGIPRRRSSVQETKESARSGRSGQYKEEFSKIIEDKIETKQFIQKTYQKPFVMINSNGKNITTFNKESKNITTFNKESKNITNFNKESKYFRK